MLGKKNRFEVPSKQLTKPKTHSSCISINSHKSIVTRIRSIEIKDILIYAAGSMNGSRPRHPMHLHTMRAVVGLLQMSDVWPACSSNFRGHSLLKSWNSLPFGSEGGDINLVHGARSYQEKVI
jgi:hypothetical protein